MRTVCWLLLLSILTLAAEPKKAAVHGFVVDSACAFVKNLKNKVDANCAAACARAGSPLLIMADDGSLYWPIAEVMPAANQNPRLMEFAGQRVIATGKVYDRGGSRAIALERVEVEAPAK
jgi:hypothetical protein